MTNVVRHTLRRMRSIIGPRFSLVEAEDDFPAVMRKRTLYVLAEDGQVWAAAMTCPCGCKAILHLNLLADQRPCWHLNLRDGGSLMPSVWRKDHCGAHFWFREGRVHWTADQRNTLWRDLRLRLGR